MSGIICPACSGSGETLHSDENMGTYLLNCYWCNGIGFGSGPKRVRIKSENAIQKAIDKVFGVDHEGRPDKEKTKT